MEFNEWMPRGGWVKYRKRQELKEKILTGFAALVLLFSYCVCGYIERGM